MLFSKKILFVIPFILFGIIVLFSKSTIALTSAEKDFLKSHPIIRVQNENDYPPYDFAVSGKPSGYSIDYLKLIAQKLNIEFKFINGYTWAEILDNIKNRKLDIIHTCSPTKEREKFAIFTKPFLKKFYSLIVEPKSKIQSFRDLENKKLVMLKGTSIIDEIKAQYPKINIIEVNSSLQIIKMISVGEVDAGCDNIAMVSYLIKDMLISNIEFRRIKNPEIIKSTDAPWRIGVRSDWPILKDIIEKAMVSLSENELKFLKEKWLGIIENKEKKIDFTDEEIKYIAKTDSVNIAVIKSFRPFSYFKNGELNGLSIDLIKLIAKKTKLNIIPTSNSWSNNIKKFKAKKIDLIDCISYKKERAKFTSYTKPYYEIPTVIFSRTDFKLFNKIKSISALKGIKIGITKDIFYTQKLKDAGAIIVEFKDKEKKMKALAFGNIDLVTSGLTDGIIPIKENALTNVKILCELNLPEISKEDLRIGVNKDKKILFSIINKGFEAVSSQELNMLKHKWLTIQAFGNNKKSLFLNFSANEQKYLNEIDEIKMCVDPDWMPYERINANNEHEGIIADYIKILQNRIGKKITLIPTKTWNETIQFAKDRKCDIISAASETKSRKKYMNFTNHYLEFPTVIVSKMGTPFIGNIESVKDKKFAVVKGYSVAEIMKNHYPNIELIEVDNSSIGFEKIRQNEVFGFIDALPTISYQMQKNGMNDLKIAGKTEITYKLCIAVRNDNLPLLNIFQKSLNSITKLEKQKISNKWLSIKYDKGFDYSLFWKIVLGIIIILLFSLYWNHKLSSEIANRKKIENSLKNAYEALEIAKEKAEIANNAKSEFLANMSHELRTPLNAVIGFSELLSTMELNNKEKSFIESIKTAGKTLLTLINDILDLSKIEANMLQIKTDIIDIRNIFEEMKQLFEVQIRNKGLKFIFDIDENIPNALILDEVRIRQILLNLIGNAKKFTEKGYIKIIAKNLASYDEKIDLLIGIEDTGIGINKNSLTSIFEPFKQQDGHDTKKFGGTGLGLSICKKLAIAMNGSISVKSTVLKGSVFEVILNNVNIASYDSNSITKKEYLDLENIHFEKANILIVDDIESNRIVVKELLLKIGLNVITAQNGQIALDLIKINKPDLIFMDIRMPVLDGIKTTVILKSSTETKNIPIIALTASSSANDKEVVMKNGFDEYMEKPFKIHDLLSILSKYLKYSLPNKNKNNNLQNEAYENSFDIINIRNDKEFLKILIDKILPLSNSLKNVMVMGKIQKFAISIKEIANIHNCKYLNKCGTELITFADNFDTIGIEDKLNELSSKINILKK